MDYISYSQQADYVANHFTQYLLRQKLITTNGIPKNQLLNFYTDYYKIFPSFVSVSDILSALRKSRLIKRIPISDVQGNLIMFKEEIFETPFAEETIRPKKRVFTNQQFVFRNKSNRDSVITEHKCELCKLEFKNSKDENNHLASPMHVLRNTYRTKKKLLTTLSSNLIVEGETTHTLLQNEQKCFKITLKNTFGSTVQFARVFNLLQSTAIKLNCNCPQDILSGEKFELEVKAKLDTLGGYVNPIIFQLHISGRDEVDNFLVEVAFHVGIEDVNEYGPKVKYQQPKRNVIVCEELPIVKGTPLKSSNSKENGVLVLRSYKVPSYIIHILNRGFKSVLQSDQGKLKEIKKILCNEEGIVSKNIDALNADNYVQRFQLLLWMEEHQMTKEIHNYDRSDQILKLEHNGLYQLDVPQLAEERPSVLKGDYVFVKKNDEPNVLYQGYIHQVKEDGLLLAFSKRFHYLPGSKVSVQFTYSRYVLRLCYQALELIGKSFVNYLLFPKSYCQAPKDIKLKPWFNSDIEKNFQQKTAVSNIVQSTSFPAPYILFGPPGTGKTITVVESILQLWSLKLGRIFVCTPSNSAADLITERLLKEVPESDIFRLYGASRDYDLIPKKIMNCCNYRSDYQEFYFPSKKFILKRTIVISTLATSGRLINTVEPGIFKYLFIDEAGHAMEPEMLIPICGLLINRSTGLLNGNLILAGDPKQLGPMIQSSLATALGLDMSFLERIMSQCTLYKEEKSPKVITKLINNYRSHPDILFIPNKLFYDNELVARGNEKIINLGKHYSKLVNKDIPIIFHGVQGIEQREGNSPSFFNLEEMQILLNYLDNLVGCKLNGYTVKQADIGIITPYKKQVQKCRQLITQKRKWPDIQVASVEQFQGQEKLIIIITTVRSRQEFLATDYQFGIGFLRNPKRFNVALTRAKALVIIIGNPDILQCDPNWRELVYYCVDNGCFIGYKPAKNLPPDFDPREKLGLDLSALNLRDEEEDEENAENTKNVD